MASPLLFLLSFLIVGLGRPALFPWIGLLSFVSGFALFFRSVEKVADRRRVWLAFFWYSSVQLIQLNWFLSHPYNYIYLVWFFLSLLWGGQFAFFAYLVPKAEEITLSRRLALSGLWVLFEWSRLFVLSGFSWNPIGLSPTGLLPFLHLAPFIGIYGISFIAIFLNLTVLEGMRKKRFMPSLLILLLVFIVGYAHFSFRKKEMEKEDKAIAVALVQTAFPVEEALHFSTLQESISYIQEEWASIYASMASIRYQKIDLILLPEFVVPYGTYMPIYSLDKVEESVVSKLGDTAIQSMPDLGWPYAFQEGGKWKVTNAFLAQTLANFFHADLMVGFEDAERISAEVTEQYNAALFFKAGGGDAVGRYEKRVLVPMGEYIPFSFCRELCKSYGVFGSFTPGTKAKGFVGDKVIYGPSICYEETYGHLMRENKGCGVELLCNLTSDVWYPNSSLPQEHLAHARPRTVEMGLPLVRACNTGVTIAMNSVGESLAGIEGEWTRGAMVVKVPLYSYETLYSIMGDYPILIIASLSLLGFLQYRRKGRV